LAQNNSYLDGESEVGSYDEDEIFRLIQAGVINANSRIRNANQRDWVSADKSYFKSCFAAGQPLSFREAIPARPALNNTFAWLLACAPVVSVIAFKLGSFWFTLLGLIATLIFWVMDSEIIWKVSDRHKRWTWLGLIFVPVYLFIRAALTDHKFGYAISGICFYALAWKIAFILYEIIH